MKPFRKAGRNDPDARYAAAAVLFNAGQHQQAGDICRTILRKLPRHADCIYILGAIDLKAGRFGDALEAFDRALALRPGTVAFMDLRGNALLELGRSGEAIAVWREAVGIDPAAARPLVNLAGALRYTGEPDEALALYERALRMRPGDPVVLNGIGLSQLGLCRYADSERSFRAALANDPGNTSIRLNLGTLLLRLGRFEKGLEDWEARLQGDRLAWFAGPNWDGAPLDGRTLLVVADEGLGDFINGCRYIPEAARQGPVAVAVPPPLRRLAERLPGVEQVVAMGDPFPPFDAHCSAFSLWRAFHSKLGMFPGSVPYLAPDPADAERWKQRVAGLPGRRIGLAWAGSAAMRGDAMRSIPFALIAPLLETPDTTFVSLQMQRGQDAAGARLIDWTSEFGDLADTAALIQNLDLVIAVDTAIAHLAGALGRPVWMLNRWAGNTDPRWLVDRETTDWYPTMRIFYQRTRKDWAEVVARVAAALRTPPAPWTALR